MSKKQKSESGHITLDSLCGFFAPRHSVLSVEVLQSSVLSLLDHCLVGGDVDLDTAVLGAAFLGGVVGHRHGVGLAFGGHT